MGELRSSAEAKMDPFQGASLMSLRALVLALMPTLDAIGAPSVTNADVLEAQQCSATVPEGHHQGSSVLTLGHHQCLSAGPLQAHCLPSQEYLAVSISKALGQHLH